MSIAREYKGKEMFSNIRHESYEITGKHPR
jgi:hypothetical protein